MDILSFLYHRETHGYFVHFLKEYQDRERKEEKTNSGLERISLAINDKHEDTFRVLRGERLTGKGIHRSVAPVAKLLAYARFLRF